MWLPDLADAAWVGDVLARHSETLGLAGEVTSARLVDVRLTNPQRPESARCRGWATYVVTLHGGASAQLYLKGFPDRASSESAWLQDRASREQGRSDLLAGHDLVVWRFPEDPQLAALPELLASPLEPDVVPAAVATALGVRSGLHAAVVRYQPEASATLRVEGPHGETSSAFAKLLAAGSVTTVAARHHALWSRTGPQEPLRIAEPLATDPVRRVLWTRGVPGTAVVDAVPAPELARATSTVGPLLAALHASTVGPMPRTSADDLIVEMLKKAGKLALAHAALEPVVSDLVAASTRRRRDVTDERLCSLHGDFHLDQLVASGDGPVLVDLDSMVHGPPEIDLAEFLVDLALRGLPEGVAGQVADGLLSSYTAATGTGIDAALLDICAAAEFVNRCYRHLRRHTPGWQQDLEAELGRYGEVTQLLRG